MSIEVRLDRLPLPVTVEAPKVVSVEGAGHSIDSFGRWRVSQLTNVFDSKQIFDNQPLLWDEALESGASISSAHSTATASTVITSTVNTAGVFTRQTFQRFNYQPGKSQQILMTGVLQRSGGGVGVTRRIGYFDDDNGLFFEDDAGIVGLVRRTSVTGSPVDNRVAQSDWNIDTMDGSGPSGVTVDWTKGQIFCMDFSWLGSGRVRMALVLDGIPIPIHTFPASNELALVYMSTPNLPLRYQMVTANPSAASTMEAICTMVASEGGVQSTGILHHVGTGGTHIDANTENVAYAVVGIRLKSTHLAASVDLVSISFQEQQGTKSFDFRLVWNPTVAGAFTYGDLTNSAVQFATGATANTVTGGTDIQGAFGQSSQFGGVGGGSIENVLRLGAAIDGTPDEIVLVGTPVGGSTNADFEGSITWREPT